MAVVESLGVPVSDHVAVKVGAEVGVVTATVAVWVAVPQVRV